MFRTILATTLLAAALAPAFSAAADDLCATASPAKAAVSAAPAACVADDGALLATACVSTGPAALDRAVETGDSLDACLSADHGPLGKDTGRDCFRDNAGDRWCCEYQNGIKHCWVVLDWANFYLSVVA